MEQPSLRRRSLSPPSLRGGGSSCCGGTTAGGCAALVCCGPCSLVSLVVLTVYKLPRGLCRRVRQAKKKEKLENGDSEKKMSKSGSSQFAVHPLEKKDEEGDEDEDEEIVKLEEEMWKKFNGGGFWRSHSQAETASSHKK